MKKLFAGLSTCLLALCLLVSCGSKMGAIKKSFEKADYVVAERAIDDKDSVIKSINVVKKGLNGGMVIELGSTKDLETALNELKDDPDAKNFIKLFGDDMKKVAAKLEEAGLVNGNCVFVGTPDAVAVFKKA